MAIIASISIVRAAGAGAVSANLLHTGRRIAVSSPLAHVHTQHACMHTLVYCMSASYGGRIKGGSAADTLQTHLTRSSTCPPRRRRTLPTSSRRSHLSTCPQCRRRTRTRLTAQRQTECGAYQGMTLTSQGRQQQQEEVVDTVGSNVVVILLPPPLSTILLTPAPPLLCCSTTSSSSFSSLHSNNQQL